MASHLCMVSMITRKSSWKRRCTRRFMPGERSKLGRSRTKRRPRWLEDSPSILEKRGETQLRTAVAFILAVSLAGVARSQEVPKDYAHAANYLGRKGDFKASVFRIGIPRSDLHVR